MQLDKIELNQEDFNAWIFLCEFLHMTKSMCIAVELSKFFSTIVNFIMSAF